MPTNFVIWAAKAEPNACLLSKLENVPDAFDLYYCRPRAASFPTDALFNMDPDYPNDIILCDNVANTDGVIVTSPAIKSLLERFNIPSIEYLPVAIYDHKKKLAGSYFLAHLIEPIDCIDRDKSVLRWDAIDPNCIARVRKLVIDESLVPPGQMMFRPKHFHDIALVHRELAQAITQQGFTGVRWIEIDNYPE